MVRARAALAVMLVAVVGGLPDAGHSEPAPLFAGLDAGVPESPGTTAVDVRVWPHEGFGRIVFDWPEATEHTASLDGRRLAIRFAEPLAATLTRITGRLSRYVVAAERGEDKRSVVLTLAPGVRYKTFPSGNSTVVDLLPGRTPGKEAGETAVRVRTGEHDTFSRFVFDWKSPVGYAVDHESDAVVVRFDRSARLELAAGGADLPRLIRSAAEARAERGAAFRIGTAERADVRHFRSGTHVVVDILKPSAAASGAVASGKTDAASTDSDGREDSGDARANMPSAKPEPRSTESTATASVRPDRDDQQSGGRGKTPDARAGAGSPAPQSGAGEKPASGGPTALLAARLREAVQAADQVAVTLELKARAAVIRFLWRDEVGAAVFERAGYLWAVFDRETAMSISDWFVMDAAGKTRARYPAEREPRADRPAAAVLVSRPKLSRVPGGTVFRMRLPDGVHARVDRQKATWSIILEREPPGPATGVPVESHLAAAAGARLFLPVPEAGPPLSVEDPAVGDRLWVVPLSTPGKGIGLGRTFAEVKLFASAQGIAGRTLRDGVTVRALPQGIEIAAANGLALSGTNIAAGRSTAKVGASTEDGSRTRPGWLFDFESWRREADGSFIENKQALQRAAALASPATRNPRRFELAQLYFSHDHLAETLGLLRVIAEDEPELALEPVFRAVRGASHYRLGNYDRAEHDLFHQSLDTYKEISLWRAGVAAVQEDWVRAARYFSRAEAVFRAYPEPLRLHFGLLAAETALNIGDVGLAKFHLDSLLALDPEPSDRARIAYLRGRLLEKVLDSDGAVEAWREAMGAADRRIRVKAALDRTALLLRQDKIGLEAAIEGLEKLRYAWRGDTLEFRLLRRLGALYVRAGDYKNGLLTLREAARYFPDHPDADSVIETMRSAFVKLYIGGEADQLAPLTALALYDEFRDLTPEGEVGDRLVSNLADRLIEVDLLDRAAKLLKHLVDVRLKGLARLEVANRLALVYLLDRRPEKALEALAGQLPNDLIPEAATARRHLKARALGELARYDEALKLVAGDSSRDAVLLKAEIYWRKRDWANAAGAYSKLVAGDIADRPKAKLDDPARRNVLSLAISYALNGDRAALGALRDRFGAAMAESRYKEAFAVVAGDSGRVVDDYSVISRKVAEVDQFGAFMKSYREKLLSPRAAKAKAKQSAERRGSRAGASSS